MDRKDFDFSGWATRNNLKCSDGRVILPDAFIENDGQTVPLVWNHQHNDQVNVLGHALLENRKEGVYAYCKFNNTESGENARKLVENRDITALSIYANRLKHQGCNVKHGMIREVSLVLASANPGAFIDSVIRHGEESEDEAIIFTGEDICLEHSDNPKKEDEKGDDMTTEKDEKKKEQESAAEKTVADVFDTLNEEQKEVVYALVGQAYEDGQNDKKENKNNDEEDEEEMKHNVFDNESTHDEDVLSHAEIEGIFTDAKRYGSLKDSVLAHGIDNIEYLFPDAKTINNIPDFIQREMGWVQNVMNGTHHVPFSRIKSMHANITEDEARAKGYMKGNKKKDEVFTLLKRTTIPQTIYKKQSLERDDVIDITDFDVVAWLKAEMRMMLDEEIARAVLVGDGRMSSSDDKINEQNIRPIWKDDDLYTIKKTVAISKDTTDDQKARAFIRTAIKARKEYRGSGYPTLFAPEDTIADCLLIEDSTGRVIYDSIEKLKTTLRVKDIVPVPVMENQTRTDENGKTRTLMGIFVDLNDYALGADKGGSVNMFDDFDIDFNQQKYLIETRCSGALTKPYSALVIEAVDGTVEVAG